MTEIKRIGGRKRRKMPPGWKTTPRVCKWCEKEYLPIRAKQKYCSVTCREEFWAGNKRWMPDPESVTLEELNDFMKGYLRQVHFLPDHGAIQFDF